MLFRKHLRFILPCNHSAGLAGWQALHFVFLHILNHPCPKSTSAAGIFCDMVTLPFILYRGRVIMALVNLNMNSKYLGGNTEVTIILPDRPQRDEVIAIIKLTAKR